MLIFSEKLRKIWNGWEVRGLILVSLILQIFLIIFGSRRKFTVSVMLSIPVWSAYLIADSVATIALGNLAYSQADSDDELSKPSGNLLRAFWAPFLLLHLGGPDTITAYSLEDNELWLRHFLGLIIQVGVAFYVYLRSWSDNALTFIAIPMFITGIIKYGERTLVLRSSSVEHVNDSLLSFRIDLPLPDQESSYRYLAQAYILFKRSAYLFANMTVDYYGLTDYSYSIMHNKRAEDAFKLVEAELGFMYDVLFTKATIVYSRFGIFLRCISFVSSISALIVFSIIIDIHAYPIADISLTYSLLVAAVFLEIYALVLLLLSDWTKIWLIKLKTSESNPTSRKPFQLSSRVFNYFFSATATDSRKRWSRSMAQYNLISSCLDNKSATSIIVDFINKLVDIKYWFLTRKVVDSDLQNMIFEQLQEQSKEIILSFDSYVDKRQSLKKLLDRRGDYVLKKSKNLDIIWSTTEVDFDHSLLVWHIATDLYYINDPDQNLGGDNKFKKISKHLSDYMMYLLEFCSSMLPQAISFETKYNDTYKEIKSTISISTSKEQKSVDTDQFTPACKELLLYHVKNKQREEDLSVLHHGVRLANELLKSNNARWKAISEVWIEMLTYAANRCAWKEHERQLTNGGELLTHVSLLMAHLGLSEQYQMKKTSIPDSATRPTTA